MDQKSILKAAQEESKRTGLSVSVIIGLWDEEAIFGTAPAAKRSKRYMIQTTGKVAQATRRAGTAIGTPFKSILPRIQQK
ncbi:hypothetical protein [Saccharibacillus brassicae]|uniref:Uncharacterized protein n=1 Tax=Saccharibacillus brassicae TaxID=2583377 RepID=A0A4Y6V1E6_SACBS|nr:hypothetical protein [Saccharibacillus brassicae]QDH23184.1 hypothetical protein FFV09_21355 [Saccharibacillus brassicae]